MRTIMWAILSASFLIPFQVEALTLVTEENPPLNFTRDGQLLGVAPTVVNEILSRAGIKADIRVLSWKDAYAQAQSDPDTCVFSTARLPARERMFQWVGPIASSSYSAFALEGFRRKITHADDLMLYRVGVVRDARAEYLKGRGFLNLVEMERDQDIPARLTTDERNPQGIDIWMTQVAGAEKIAQAAGVGAIKIVFDGILSQEYYLACHPKLAPATLKALRAASWSMDKDGTYRRLNAQGRD